MFGGSVARHMTAPQAQRLLQQAITGMGSTPSAETLSLLGQSGEALAGRLPPASARDLFYTVLASPALRGEPPTLTIASQRRATSEQAAALLSLGRALIRRMKPSDAETATPILLRAIGGTIAVSNEERMLPILEDLMRGWPEARTTQTLLRLIAWAGSPAEAVRWADRLTKAVPSSSGASGIATVVEAMKYPSAAGNVTETLLEHLKTIDATAPGKDAGIAATLDWLAGAYPSIGLAMPPNCPAPLAPALTCPSSAR